MKKKTSNSAIGSFYERELTKVFKQYGYFSHFVQTSQNGQPFDFIAFKDGVVITADCKHCTNDRFQLYRIEPNQQMALSYARAKGAKYVGIIIYFQPIEKFKWFEFPTGWENIPKSVKYDELIDFEEILK